MSLRKKVMQVSDTSLNIFFNYTEKHEDTVQRMFSDGTEYGHLEIYSV